MYGILYNFLSKELLDNDGSGFCDIQPIFTEKREKPKKVICIFWFRSYLFALLLDFLFITYRSMEDLLSQIM